jgi:predicted dehydrogenase
VLDRGLGVRALALPARPRATSAGEAFALVDSYASATAQGATAAIIATATGRHLTDAMDGIAAGYHLLVEKPVASSAAGLDALETAARDARRHVFVGCCLRFHASLLRFRELLPRIGEVHHVRIECQSFLPDWRPGTDHRVSYSARRDEGGVLRDLIHEIDYAAWLFGWPSAVWARLGNTGALGIDAEEWAELGWEAPSARAVSIRLDYLTRPSRRIMRAHGERGTLEVDLVGHRVVLQLAGEPAYTADVPQERDDMMRDQARAFLTAASGGDPGDLATLEEGAKALAICDAARASSETGEAVVVRDWRSA